MILPNHYQQLPPISMHMVLVFSTNRRMLKNQNVSNKEFSLVCQLAIDKKLSVHFGKDKAKAILFPKVKCLNKVNISVAGFSIK